MVESQPFLKQVQFLRRPKLHLSRHRCFPPVERQEKEGSLLCTGAKPSEKSSEETPHHPCSQQGHPMIPGAAQGTQEHPVASAEQTTITTRGIIIKMWTRMVLSQHHPNSTKQPPQGDGVCSVQPQHCERSLLVPGIGEPSFLSVLPMASSIWAFILKIVYRG